MKLFLMALLSGSCIYSMQDNTKEKLPDTKVQYYRKVAEIAEKHQVPVTNKESVKNIEPAPGNIVFPMHIVGLFSTYNNNNWYEFNVTIRSKL